MRDGGVYTRPWAARPIKGKPRGGVVVWCGHGAAAAPGAAACSGQKWGTTGCCGGLGRLPAHRIVSSPVLQCSCVQYTHVSSSSALKDAGVGAALQAVAGRAERGGDELRPAPAGQLLRLPRRPRAQPTLRPARRSRRACRAAQRWSGRWRGGSLEEGQEGEGRGEQWFHASHRRPRAHAAAALMNQHHCRPGSTSTHTHTPPLPLTLGALQRDAALVRAVALVRRREVHVGVGGKVAERRVHAHADGRAAHSEQRVAAGGEEGRGGVSGSACKGGGGGREGRAAAAGLAVRRPAAVGCPDRPQGAQTRPTWAAPGRASARGSGYPTYASPTRRRLQAPPWFAMACGHARRLLEGGARAAGRAAAPAHSQVHLGHPGEGLLGGTHGESLRV